MATALTTGAIVDRGRMAEGAIMESSTTSPLVPGNNRPQTRDAFPPDARAKALENLKRSLDSWDDATDEAVNTARTSFSAGFITEDERDAIYATADIARRAISQGREALAKTPLVPMPM
jgi:hypothetical protein